MIVSVDELIDYMSNVEVDEDQRTAAELIIEGVQSEVELFLNRPVEVREVTETVWPDQDGFLWLKGTPIVELLSVTDAAGAPVALTYFTIAGNALQGGYVPGPLTVRYRGGLDGKTISALKLTVLRVAAREMQNRHDDTLSVKDLSADHVTPLPIGLQPEDELRIARLRRRVIA